MPPGEVLLTFDGGVGVLDSDSILSLVGGSDSRDDFDGVERGLLEFFLPIVFTTGFGEKPRLPPPGGRGAGDLAGRSLLTGIEGALTTELALAVPRTADDADAEWLLDD